MKVNKCFLVVSVIVGMGLLYSRCVNSSTPGMSDVRGPAYAGSASCAQCHKDVAGSYLHDKHFQTSWAVSSSPGKIKSDSDSFIFNDFTKVVIEKRDTSNYQVAYVNGKESITKKFDIGFGSGEKANTFGYWQDKTLYQLPLSYFTSIHGWANSPGFPARRANFQRPIIRRCFECHSSYVAEDMEQAQSITQVRKLDRNSILYGIDCERCHGPAAKHVQFHTENTTVKESRYITKWITLSRQQKLDACAVCHSGNDLTTQQSTFAFAPGDTLSKFYYPEFAGGFANVPDVHGKQVQLLEASKCFRMSATMECSGCHSSHEKTPPTIADYSKQCVTCHKQADHNFCPLESTLGNAINSKCVDCHMPEQASKAISFQVMGKEKLEPYLLRTHRIAVYKDESEKIISGIKTGGDFFNHGATAGDRKE